MVKRCFTVVLVLFLFCACKSKIDLSKEREITDYKNLVFKPLTPKDVADFRKSIKKAQILVEPGYYVWGLSVIKWKGKYHAYYSRWKKEQAHKGWMTHCEIAHAVSSNPEGPFKFENVVLSAKKEGGWDLNNSHNPYAVIANGKVCLYYIANDIRDLLKKESIEYPDEAWFENNRTQIRDSQRIGVALADNPSGPFVRSVNIVVEPDNAKFKKIAVNPAVIYKDGQFLMIMKGDDLGFEKPFRIQLVGTSNKPDGPFNFQTKPVYAEAQTEDACMWFDQVLNKHYMVCHVMGKKDLALFNSEDGLNWKMDESRPVFMKKEFVLSDGSIWIPKRVERPFVLTNEKGQPTMIYVAVYDNDVNGNIAIPIEYKKDKPTNEN